MDDYDFGDFYGGEYTAPATSSADAALSDYYGGELEGGGLGSTADLGELFGSSDLGDYYAGENTGGALSTSGSPNIGSPSANDIVTAGGGSPETKGNAFSKALGIDSEKSLLDPKNLEKIIKMGMGVASFAQGISAKGKGQNQQNAQQLQQQLVQKHTTWTPQQQQWNDRFFYNPSTPVGQRPTTRPGVGAAGPSSIVASRGYADGGSVQEDPFAPSSPLDIWNRTRRARETSAGVLAEDPRVRLQQGRVTTMEEPRHGVTDLMRSIPLLLKGLMANDDDVRRKGFAIGGDVLGPGGALAETAGPFVGHVVGDGGGQDDVVDASLAPGEFVFDAETVSAVGDGNNDKGAELLEQWRQQLREMKRAAPTDEIPPQTGDLNQYMPGAA